MNDTQFNNVDPYLRASVGNAEKGEIEVSLGSVEKKRNLLQRRVIGFI